MKGVLYDQPHVIEEARTHLAKENLLDRCQLLGGDFFEKIPAGFDAYLLKYIIHDWEDVPALKILKNLHQAMTKEARLLIVEQAIPEGNEPCYAKVVDLFMMTLLGGAERTEEAFKNLFEQAGFTLNKIFPTPYLLSVIEGCKVFPP